MTRRVLGCLLGLTAIAAPLGAQHTVRCTADTYGTSSNTTTSTRCSNGMRSTSERIGTTVYTRDNTGYRSTLEEVGSTAYYRANTGVRGTAETYGLAAGASSSSTTYYRDNTGRRATVDRYDSPYGSTSTYRDNQGTRGTIDVYGSNTFGRFTGSTVAPPLWPRR
jgi:hypothetical protein